MMEVPHIRVLSLWRPRSQQRSMPFLNRLLFIVVTVIAAAKSYVASAGDYTVSYAFDGTTVQDVAAAVTSPLNEQGTRQDCRYDTFCTIRLEKSDLEIRLDVSQASRHGRRIFVSANGGRAQGLACCYFSDGERTFSRELREPFVKLHVYDGHRRKGNEFVQNFHLGVLYLQFSGLR